MTTMNDEPFRQLEYLTSPEKLATPTIRSAYQAAMDKVRAGQLLPLTPSTPHRRCPTKSPGCTPRCSKPESHTASAPAPKLPDRAPTPTSANSATSSSPTQRPPRRSAYNSMTFARYRPMPKPAAGTTKLPATSVSQRTSISTFNDYAATPPPTRPLDPDHEGRLMGGTSLSQRCRAQRRTVVSTNVRLLDSL